MITYTGRSVWPENDTAPSLQDIAIGLGRTARFAGQVRFWYPVLAHTIVVSRLVRPKNRIHALLHDAPEAVVGDVPTPWKTDAARANEAELLERIYDELDIKLPGRGAVNDVKRADRKALAAEAHVLGHAAAQRFWPRPNEHAMDLTRSHHTIGTLYLDPNYSWGLFSTLINNALA